MNFHPTLLAFIHTHAHRHRGRNPVLPLRPPPTLPRYFSKGIPRGLPKHSDSCIPPQQRHVFPAWLPPHCLWTAVTWSLPPLMPHKDSQENNPFCLFQSETNQDGDPCHSPLFSPLLLWPCPDPLTFLSFLSYNAEVPWHIKEHEHLQMMMGENNIDLSLLV